ncbi:endonuclease V, partial [Homo sapiens]
FGVACHLGVLTDLPCVGVAKKLLQVDGLENNALHKEKIRLLQTRGDSFPLLGDSGTVLGMADICSREHIRKSLGLPGPPTPRSPKAQRPVACPKGDSGESSGGAPSPQRQADRTTPGGRRSTAQHQVGQR